MKKQLKLLIISIVANTLLHAQYFKNPILAGFYPDPSICKGKDGYYLTVSSFAYYPGLPIFFSKDLLNWQQIGHILNRPEQLNLDGAGVSRGLFAPSITYHKGTYYAICTLVDRGGNFVVTTTNPQSNNWSNPVFLPEINGIDPSIFFDDNDKAYIVYNSIPPNNISMHDGHRTIRINEFDAEQLKVVSDNRIIVNGGTDMAKKPVWIEAPHILKKDGWYYLICAEGGTAYNHSEVVFRTKQLSEPFLPYEHNPILTQRHLNPARKNPVTTAGHADFVQDDSNNWWAVFLACRPYEKNYFNNGRETFMAPVKWKNDWPVIDLGGDEVKYSYPINATIKKGKEVFSGNYLFRDNFNAHTLNNRFIFLRTVRQNWYTQKNGLNIQLQSSNIHEKANPSFVGFRQAHLQGYAATSLTFKPEQANEQAGLMIFQNEHHYYYLSLCKRNDTNYVQLFKGAGDAAADKTPLLLKEQPVALTNHTIDFKIEADKNAYHFYFATKVNQWQAFFSNADATFLSTEVAKGFVGCVFAMYATANGSETNNTALYRWFEYKGNDEIYRAQKKK